MIYKQFSWVILLSLINMIFLKLFVVVLAAFSLLIFTKAQYTQSGNYHHVNILVAPCGRGYTRINGMCRKLEPVYV